MMASGEGILAIIGGLILASAYISWFLIAIIGLMVYWFAIYLIADKNLEGWPAMQYAFQGLMKNFWGVTGTVIVGQLMIMIGMMMCIVPGISFGKLVQAHQSHPISYNEFYVELVLA